MNDYTLNDIKYNPQEVSLFVKDDNYMPDKKAIEKEFEKNRELFNRFKEEGYIDGTIIEAKDLIWVNSFVKK